VPARGPGFLALSRCKTPRNTRRPSRPPGQRRR
jgi:hypothetical protein